MTKKLDPEDFYTTEEGFIVFTEHHHLKRGHCCESGCKHCPYGFDKATGTYKKRKKYPFKGILHATHTTHLLVVITALLEN